MYSESTKTDIDYGCERVINQYLLSQESREKFFNPPLIYQKNN